MLRSIRINSTIKVKFSFSFEQSPLKFLFELDKNIASNWDLYLITILTILLGMIFYFRRPPIQNIERDNHRSQETSTSQPTVTPTTPTETDNSVNSDQ